MRASRVNSVGKVWVVIANLEHKSEVEKPANQPLQTLTQTQTQRGREEDEILAPLCNQTELSVLLVPFSSFSYLRLAPTPPG